MNPDGPGQRIGEGIKTDCSCRGQRAARHRVGHRQGESAVTIGYHERY